MVSNFITTEYGPIPTDWDIKEIKNIADDTKDNSFIDGDWIESEYIEHEGIRLIQTGNIGLGFFKDKSSKKFISEKTFKELKCKEVKEGDILICRLADPIGRSCVVPNLGTKNITSVDVAILRPQNSDYDIFYINYSLNSPKTLNKVSSFASGTTRQRISRKNLGAIRIPVPPIKEQQKIAAILSSVDEAIEKTEQIIEKTAMLEKGLIKQLFKHGLKDNGYKNSYLGKIPSHWELKQMSELVVEFKEKTTINNQHAVLTSSREGLMLQTDYYKGRITSRDNIGYHVIPNGYITYRSRSDDGKFVFNKNDIVEIGIISHFYPVFDLKDCIKEYVLIYLNNFLQQQINASIVGTSQLVLSFNKLKNFVIALPPIEEQKEIMQKVTSVVDKIESEKNKLKQLQKIKQGLMQQLLTGKVRVQINEDEEVPS